MAYRRRKYLVNKAYQFRYSLFLIFLIMVLFLIVAISTYYLVYPILSKQFLGAITEKQANAVATRLIFFYLIETLIFIIFTLILAILFSHRVVGPVNRFTALVDRIKEGDYSIRIHLREHDEFKKLADSLNELFIKIENDFKKIKEIIEDIRKKAEHIEDEVLKENIISKLDEIKRELS
ncbi:MAG: hypothetical protein DRI36_01385 [Caldiserica bacterium]|nr:MAG: hypothetical protein DRI36_01385 [Caldisericota bacterium]